mgnify:CR=1 FL=1
MEYIAETPYVPTKYCPGCEPARDPTEECLVVDCCGAHAPTRDGVDDDKMAAGAYLAGSQEAGVDANRAWCDLLHREELGR